MSSGGGDNSLSIASRLRHLELALGLSSGCANTTTTNSFTTRLTALETKYASLKQSGTWNEIDGLIQELSPGTALTHQKQIMAPLLYRKQAVLAVADTLKTDLHHAQTILSLLTIDQDISNTNKHITQEQCVNAPIVTPQHHAAATTDSTVHERLTSVVQSSTDLQQRIQRTSDQLDAMLDHYQKLVAAVSEKLVLLHEHVRAAEQQQQQQQS